MIQNKKKMEDENDVVQEFFDKIEYIISSGRNSFWNEIAPTKEGLWIYYKVVYLGYSESVKY